MQLFLQYTSIVLTNVLSVIIYRVTSKVVSIFSLNALFSSDCFQNIFPAITLFLSMVVYLLLLQEMLPNATRLPIISTVYLIYI